MIHRIVERFNFDMNRFPSILTTLAEDCICYILVVDAPGPAAGVHLSVDLWAEVRWVAGTPRQCADNGDMELNGLIIPLTRLRVYINTRNGKYIQHFLFRRQPH